MGVLGDVHVCSLSALALPPQGGGAPKAWPGRPAERPGWAHRTLPPTGGAGTRAQQQEVPSEGMRRWPAAGDCGGVASMDPVEEAKDLLAKLESMQEGLSSAIAGGGLRGGEEMRTRIGALGARAGDLALQAERHASARSARPSRQLGGAPIHVVASLKLLQREHQSLCNILHLAHKDLGGPPPPAPAPAGFFDAPPGRQALMDEVMAANGLVEGRGGAYPHTTGGAAREAARHAPSPASKTQPDVPSYRMTSPLAHGSSPLAKFREEIEGRVNSQLKIAAAAGSAAPAAGTRAFDCPPGGGPGSAAQAPPLPLSLSAPAGEPTRPGRAELPGGVVGIEAGPTLDPDVVLRLTQADLAAERETVRELRARVARLTDALGRRHAEVTAAATAATVRQLNEAVGRRRLPPAAAPAAAAKQVQEEQDGGAADAASRARSWMTAVGSSWWRRPPEVPREQESEWVLYRDGEEVDLPPGGGGGDGGGGTVVTPPRPGHSPPSIHLPYAPARPGEGARRAPASAPEERGPPSRVEGGEAQADGPDEDGGSLELPSLAAADQRAPAVAPRITLHYDTAWPEAFLHYAAGGGGWTEVPGVPMTALGESTSLKAICVEAESLEFVINDGAGHWDSAPGGGNYKIGRPGTYRLSSGEISAVADGPGVGSAL